MSQKNQWDEDDLVTLKIMGQIFANAIERIRVEAKLRETEQRW